MDSILNETSNNLDDENININKLDVDDNNGNKIETFEDKSYTKCESKMKLKDYFSYKVKNKFLVSLIVTLIFGFIAHGYFFSNQTLSGDSLYEFENTSSWKITIGRFLVPLIRSLLGEIVTLPWLSGFLSLFFIALSVYFILKIFSIDNIICIILVSGICTTNICVTSTIATYMHDFSVNMIALLCSVVSAYFIIKNSNKFKFGILSSLFTFIGLGIYQAYLAVTLTLIFIDMILKVINGEEIKKIIKYFGRVVFYVLIAVIIWYLASFLVALINDMELAGYSGNNITLVYKNPTRIFESIVTGFVTFLGHFFFPLGGKSVSTFFSILICVFNVLLFSYSIFIAFKYPKKSYDLKRMLFLALLLILLPLVMSSVIIISTSYHMLLKYSYSLIYLFCILVITNCDAKAHIKLFKYLKVLSLVFIAFTIFSNIQVSNTVYAKKVYAEKGTYATMIRAVSKLENYENYVYGESKVIFIGCPKLSEVGNFKENSILNNITGVSNESSITTYVCYEPYFENVLNYDINLGSFFEMLELLEYDEVKNMNSFPSNDCIKEINGIIIFKMS